jgi:N-acyl homoserine lactone hydrolase
MRVHAEAKPLTAPLPGGKQGATVVVEPIRAGDVHFPRELMVGSGGRLERARMAAALARPGSWPLVPCPAFLIRHPGAGPFIVDTGLHPSVTAKPAANMGRIAATFARPKLDPGDDLPSQLRRRGVDSGDVRLAVMTHLHYDHASGMAEFPHATFILSAAEWRSATTERRPSLAGYRPAHYDYAFDYRTISYEENTDSYSTFGRTFDLFGDGSVRLAFTPGHSAGHQSVICRLRERDFVIAGDVIYVRDQLRDTPPSPRPYDAHTAKRSLQELRLFARQYPQAVIVPGHDAEHWATLEKRYE